MPRIKAASVAEHVAEQEAAVFTTAIALFVERGYQHVTLADIAAEIGLARNSLYRYFPDKAHILLRWFDQELPRQLARTTAILNQPGTPHERIAAWVRDQIDYAHHPEHELVSSLAALVPELDAAAQAQLSGAHERMLQPLRHTLAEAGVPQADRNFVATLIQGLVVAAAGHSSPGQRLSAARLTYIDRAVLGLLDG